LHRCHGSGRVPRMADAEVAKAHELIESGSVTGKIAPHRLTQAWRPVTHPEGMLHAYAYWPEDKREIASRKVMQTR